MSDEIKNDGTIVPSEEEKKNGVPYERFKEVNDKMRSYEKEIQSIKDKGGAGSQEEIKSKEAEARTYLKGLLNETLQEKETERTKVEEQEYNTFRTNVNDILSVNADVERDKFLKFIEEEADEYGVSSVESAMKLYRRMNNLEKEATEKGKKDVNKKPSSPNSTAEPNKEVVQDDSKKSIWQIAEEVIRGLDKK